MDSIKSKTKKRIEKEDIATLLTACFDVMTSHGYGVDIVEQSPLTVRFADFKAISLSDVKVKEDFVQKQDRD